MCQCSLQTTVAKFTHKYQQAFLKGQREASRKKCRDGIQPQVPCRSVECNSAVQATLCHSLGVRCDDFKYTPFSKGCRPCRGCRYPMAATRPLPAAPTVSAAAGHPATLYSPAPGHGLDEAEEVQRAACRLAGALDHLLVRRHRRRLQRGGVAGLEATQLRHPLPAIQLSHNQAPTPSPQPSRQPSAASTACPEAPTSGVTAATAVRYPTSSTSVEPKLASRKGVGGR